MSPVWLLEGPSSQLSLDYVTQFMNDISDRLLKKHQKLLANVSPHKQTIHYDESDVDRDFCEEQYCDYGIYNLFTQAYKLDKQRLKREIDHVTRTIKVIDSTCMYRSKVYSLHIYDKTFLDDFVSGQVVPPKRLQFVLVHSSRSDAYNTRDFNAEYVADMDQVISEANERMEVDD